MNKRFDDILSEKLRELPSHSPAGALWGEIEAALDTDDAISRKLPGLTTHPPSPRIWEAIEASLPATHVSRPHRRILYLTTVVAAVALLFVAITHLVHTETGITMEREIVLSEERNTGITLNREDEDFMEVIKDLCKTGAPVCQSELFKEKIQLYRELNEELRQLEEVIGQVGDSPEIIQSVIRIENLKSGTIQELIQLIHS
jgi:hypothetical protein